MSTSWSSLLTQQFRKLPSAAWAAVDPELSEVKMGDYGSIANGAFNRIGNVQCNSTITGPTAGGNLSVQESSVHTSDTGGKVTGEYFDPESETMVKAGLQWAWEFTSDQAVLAVLPTTYLYTYPDTLAALQEAQVLQDLWVAAYTSGWMNSDGTIKTGFCVVVGLLQIAAGFVVGSESSSTTFTLNGSVNAISDMMQGALNATYSNAFASSGAFQLIWPQSPATPESPGNVAKMGNLRTIGVYLASFDGYMPSLGNGKIVNPYI
jgi:hypothetical protein